MSHQHKLCLTIALAVLPVFAGMASAQYRIDNGAARDANNRLGSGGYNDQALGSTRLGGLAGNYIVTGNVRDGRAFRGSLGYTDPSAFRGNLGSASFDNFLRDSTGIAQLRGDVGRLNSATIQPYFGPGQTVAPPAGFVREINGGYTPAGPRVVQPNDARIDFGGATRSQIARSLLSEQRVIGGAGLSSNAGNWNNAAPMTGPVQLSEYTQLNRRSPDVFAPPLNSSNADPSLPRVADTPAAVDAQTSNTLAPLPTDNRVSPALTTPQEQQDKKDAQDADGARLTGQISTLKSLRVLDNNEQYAELRNRMQSRMKQLPGAEANEQIRSVSAEVARQREAGETGADRGGSAPAGRDGTARPTDNATTPPGAGGMGMGTTSTPDTASSTPGTSSASSGAMTPDTLNLPRPEGDPAAARPAGPAASGEPMVIESLASGVKDASLADQLRQAEELMRAGKFGSAIDVYARAEAVASDDPLIYMGRGIAELGGGYFRKAESRIRQAYAADPALLGAKFDLRRLVTDERLNTLIADLGQVAKTNPNDPGPVLLLAFIYYNGGMEDRAARALELAQERAGGNDETIKLLQQNWPLSPANENK